MDDVFRRLMEMRKRRGLSQEVVGSWFGVSKQSYGAKEKGNEGGLGPKEIAIFLENTRFDARYLFGQIDSIEKADLILHTPEEKSIAEQLTKELEEFRRLNNPAKDEDPVVERCRSDLALRKIVKRLLPLRGMFDRINGYLDRLAEEDVSPDVSERAG